MPVGFQAGLRLVDWVLSGASVDLDLANNRFFGSSGGSLSSYLSISRASIGYARTSGGVLTQFSSGQLRRTDLGLLIENARTNIVSKSSQEVTDVNWTSLSVTLTANSTTAPDGTVTADSITTTASGGEHYVRNQTDSADNLGAGTVACWSAYFKPAGYNYALLLVYDPTAVNYYYVKVNLLTGAVSTIAGGGTPANVTTGSEVLANGWVRAWGTMTVGANTLQIGLQVSDGGATAGFTADGVSGIYVWGAQIEAGAFPSSYIPTATGGPSATRAADAVQMIGSLATLFGGSARTSVVDLKNIAIPSSFQRVIADNNSHQELTTYSDNTHIMGAAGTALCNFASTGKTFTGGVKVGIAVSGTAVSCTGAGVAVVPDTSGQTFTGSMYLGSDGGGATEYNPAYYRRLTVWNSRLADATLQALTS